MQVRSGIRRRVSVCKGEWREGPTKRPHRAEGRPADLFGGNGGQQKVDEKVSRGSSAAGGPASRVHRAVSNSLTGAECAAKNPETVLVAFLNL